jgi:hypothetical protein
VPEEPAAVARAVALMEPGDLVVILADEVPQVLEQLRPLVVAGDGVRDSIGTPSP